MSAESLLVVESDSTLRSSPLHTNVRLPEELMSLYTHVGSPHVTFSLERLRFRPLSEIRLRGDIIPFADEVVSFSRSKVWSYDRTDDIVVSNHGDCEENMKAFIAKFVSKELRQREMNHRRYAEKCVNGVYVPSPDLAPRRQPDDFIDD